MWLWVFYAFVWIFWWRLWFWLRAFGGFRFLIHSDFLVEVVIVLRDGSGGGYGCGFLGLPLVVVDSGFAIGGGGARFGCMGFIFFV